MQEKKRKKEKSGRSGGGGSPAYTQKPRSSLVKLSFFESHSEQFADREDILLISHSFLFFFGVLF